MGFNTSALRRNRHSRITFETLNPTRYVSPGVLASPFTITRAQAAGVESSGLGSDGVTWNLYGADTARFFGTDQWLAIEGQRVNSIRNPRGEGAVVGTPGTLPTNWTSAVAAGLSREIVGTGVEDGLPYVDIRIFGTPTAATASTIVGFQSPSISVGSNLGAEFSHFTKLVGGTLTNVDSLVTVFAFSGASFTAALLAPTSASLGTQRRGYVLAIPTGTTALSMTLRFAPIIGAPVDFTFRVAAPQISLIAASLTPPANNPLLTPILPPVGAINTSTRGQDNISAALGDLGLSNLAQGTGCTVLWAGDFFATNFNGQQTIVAIDDDVAQNRFELRLGRQGELELIQAIAGVFSPDSVRPALVPPNRLIRAGMSVGPNGEVSGVFNGFNNDVAISYGSATITNALTTLRLGGSGTGAARPLTGTTRALYVAPTALSATDLSAALMAMPV